ncbi:hypothetical protein I553_4106 [Mycobacterium xenopi 4042]|uniref:Uncharacterized protein n=1 Tax=Mycobacterium xenopi 4042 TaxID=1299334 RepID=X8AFT4_MYCXE|nr:hypothetical protein I553_4106 [Mycobacterium xenopi 4042]
MTSTGTPSLTANRRGSGRSASAPRTDGPGRVSRGDPDTLLGAVMLNTSYAVVVRYSMSTR